MIDLNNFKCTFLDFETTGLGSEAGAVQLSLIRYENGKVIKAICYYINPEKKIQYGAFKTHGISQKDVESCRTFAEIWPEIKPYISGQIICAHNANFDTGVIKYNVNRYGLQCDDFMAICTMLSAKKILSRDELTKRFGDKCYGLDPLCQYFNIDLWKHHDATSDTEACYYLFMELNKLGTMVAKRHSCKQEI